MGSFVIKLSCLKPGVNNVIYEFAVAIKQQTKYPVNCV
jgi:hypothetical protein